MEWHHSVDVLVMGSGGAGQCAAVRAHDLGLEVLIVEKGDTWGGSTAMSAGAVWLPNNRAMKALGLEDSEDEGVKYLAHLTGGTIPEERLRTFIREGNRMIDYLATRTHLRFDSLEFYPDYVPEDPGGRLGGRSLDPVPFDGNELGEEFRTLHDPYPPAMIMGKFLLTVPQARTMLQPGLKPKLEVAKGLARYAARYQRRKRYDRDPFLTMGQSLVGRLRLSLIERGVPLWLRAPVESFVVEDGRVVGVTITRDGKPMNIEARRGVMVGAGGFERNDAMRKQYQRAPIEASWSVGNYDNTGDGILAGAAIGAQLDVDLMREAWWMPATLAPGVKYTNVLMIEKSLPHGIFVNRDAKRFLNEGENYNDLVIRMYEQDAKDHVSIPAWFVVDATYRSRYNLGPVLPSFVMSDKKLPPEWQPGAGWLHRADTLEGLAADIGLDPAALRAHRHALQRVRPDRRRRGLPPRRQRQRPLLLRPARQAEPDPGPDREGAVLRHPGDAQRPRHQGRAGHRHRGAGARRRREAHPRPLRRGELGVDGDGHPVRGGRRDHRPGHGVRVPGRRGDRGGRRDRRRHLTGAIRTGRCGSPPTGSPACRGSRARCRTRTESRSRRACRWR